MNTIEELQELRDEMTRYASQPCPSGEAVYDFARRLQSIVDRMKAEEQAIIEEVNKRWPTGKPQPEDAFVGDKAFAVAGTDGSYSEYGKDATPQEPDGMVLVPKEPTERMLSVAGMATESEGLVTSTWLRTEIYKAMIAAAKEEG